ncbi:MAG: oligosaccharide flippase family protein [Candidatus Norongarragalinales archaeon]
MGFLKSTLYVLAAQALVLAASFFLRPLTARFLGPAEYGLFALVLSTANVILSFTLFSLNSGVLYFTAKNPGKTKQIVSGASGFLLVFSLVLFSPLQFVILFFAPSLGFDGFTASFVLSIALSLFFILQAAQQGLEKFSHFSVYSFASALLAGLAAAAIAFYTGDGVFASWGRNLAILAVSIAGLAALNALGKPDLAEFKKVFRYSAPLAVAGFFGAFLLVADRYLLAAFKSVAEVGFYDIAYSMIAAVLPFSTALLTIMMPRIIRQESKLSFYYNKISHANAILLSAVGLIFFYYSDIFVTILLGSDFQNAILPFKILSLALPLMTLYSLNWYSATAMGKTKIAGFLISLLTVLSIAFNFWLVPLYGAVGASWANFLTYLFVAAISFYYLKTRYGVEIKQLLPQYASFSIFVIAYLVFFEQGGFIPKTIALFAFAMTTYLVNKQIVEELFTRLKHQLAAKLAKPPHKKGR